MANNDIKTRLVLQGEKEYSKGMKDAAANVKELDSRLKVVKSEFEKTGDAQKYAAEQAQILKEKIEQQQSAVKAAEDALNYLSQNGFDKNDSRMRSWRISLNNAKSELNRLESQLKKTETATEESTSAVQRQASNMSKAEESAQSYAEKLDSIDKGISFSNALTVLKTVKDTISEILTGVIEVGKGIWNYEMQAAQWATEINTKASEAGISPAVYQSYKYAAEMLGMSIDDYIEMSREIEKSLMSEDVEVAEAFNELGVATRNQDGTMRSAFEVLNEVAAAMSTVNTETRKNVLASKLLGEQYNKLNPLIIAGGDAWAHYVEEGKDIGTVSEAAFNALQELDQSRIRLSTKFETMKKEAAGQLAPGFTSITEGLTGLLGTFETFIESDKGQKAIEKINGFLTTIGESIGNIDVGNAVDKFFTKFESVDLGNAIDKVSSAVSSFTDGLSWIVENGETITKWLGGIATAFGGIKVASDVIKFLDLLNKGGSLGSTPPTTTVDSENKGGTVAVPTMGGKPTAGGGSGNPAGGESKSASETISSVTKMPSTYVTGISLEWATEVIEKGVEEINQKRGVVHAFELDGEKHSVSDEKLAELGQTFEEYVAALEKAKEEEVKAKAEQEAMLRKLVEETGGSTGEVIVNGPSAIAFGDSSETESGTVPKGAFAKAVEEQLAESVVLSKEMEAAVSATVDDYIAQLLAEIEAKTGEIEEAKEETLIEPLSDLDAAVEAAGSAGANAAAAYAAGIESQLFRVTSATARLIAASQPSGRFQNAPYLTGGAYVGGNVYIDGQTAGYILTPTVNTQLGIQTFGR